MSPAFVGKERSRGRASTRGEGASGFLRLVQNNPTPWLDKQVVTSYVLPLILSSCFHLLLFLHSVPFFYRIPYDKSTPGIPEALPFLYNSFFFFFFLLYKRHHYVPLSSLLCSHCQTRTVRLNSMILHESTLLIDLHCCSWVVRYSLGLYFFKVSIIPTAAYS